MEMNERQLIQEILNTVDVLYDFENADEDSKEYTLLITRQNNDKRDLEIVNDEMKRYFKEANFTYDEKLNPEDTKAEVRVDIARG
ncbi:hypothetical protein FD06_GL001376 [Apilactobacillus ozensis DSM 23829 = JCM 17196]|uniref:Uncharacterized protein n=1 Tax=Apilactobacillus ozensis DSM 23829 = JCM 17196 TaxID=1423781 RepID=A0A0R2ANU5_9LACO|nr:hypothetical protein [Apilactobacillus ozensis]KRM68162.1 hypothetical protein FD06_GL001376 [Apilactobacillus ozensis DSM 23829 = JCM 17196]